ncbi:MAG TPA: MBL fold metallo-hydrolase [Terriglobales bacterium]|nr:MBL fold metallo-hydrolase [Terriglobales bacterium]
MKATLTVLGSGTSMGVPTLGCPCAVCQSADPMDRRSRPSIMLTYAGKNVVIDTTPDFRAQAMRESINRVDAVIYTHPHADHILGLDDLRPLTFWGPDIPLYADAATTERIQEIFGYIFSGDYHFGGSAKILIHPLNGDLELWGAKFEQVKVKHGKTDILGFRFGSAAYVTDFSEIPAESMAQLRDLDILFLDALRHRPHPTHSSLSNSLRIVEELKPKRAFFTHISHDLPHVKTNEALPDNVRLSHDGLKLEFEI